MAANRWLDRLSLVLFLLPVAFLGYRLLAPQPSAELDLRAPGAVLPPGKVRLVTIAQTHCPACVVMRPLVSRLEARHGPAVEFIERRLDAPGDHEAIARLAERTPIRYTPTFLVVDREGRLRAKYLGLSSEAALGGALAAALEAEPGSAAYSEAGSPERAKKLKAATP